MGRDSCKCVIIVDQGVDQGTADSQTNPIFTNNLSCFLHKKQDIFSIMSGIFLDIIFSIFFVLTFVYFFFFEINAKRITFVIEF